MERCYRQAITGRHRTSRSAERLPRQPRVRAGDRPAFSRLHRHQPADTERSSFRRLARLQASWDLARCLGRGLPHVRSMGSCGRGCRHHGPSSPRQSSLARRPAPPYDQNLQQRRTTAGPDLTRPGGSARGGGQGAHASLRHTTHDIPVFQCHFPQRAAVKCQSRFQRHRSGVLRAGQVQCDQNTQPFRPAPYLAPSHLRDARQRRPGQISPATCCSRVWQHAACCSQLWSDCSRLWQDET